MASLKCNKHNIVLKSWLCYLFAVVLLINKLSLNKENIYFFSLRGDSRDLLFHNLLFDESKIYKCAYLIFDLIHNNWQSVHLYNEILKLNIFL